MNSPEHHLRELGLDPESIMGARYECVCFNIRRAARAITKLYEDRLRGFDIHTAQYSTLMAIATAGNLGVGHLAQALSTDRTTLSRTLRPLVERGLIARIPGPDKRTHGYELTQSGIDLVKRVIPVWKETQREVMEIVRKERFDAVTGAADDLLSHLGEEDPDWLRALAN